jgi:hypothetical protein
MKARSKMSKRTIHIDIRTTPEEKALYIKKAKKCGLSLSAYFRMIAKSHKPKAVPPLPYYDIIKVLSDSYNLFRKYNDINAAQKILNLVKLMTDEISPEEGNK